MSRTYFVKFNIDTFRSCMADLDGQPDSAYRDWMRGFNRGVNGKQPTDESGALRAGMAMGWESFTEAQDYRAKQAEKGKQSADARREKRGTAQPPPNRGSTTVQPRFEPDPEPTNNQQPTSTNENPSTIFYGEQLPTRDGVGYRLPMSVADKLVKAYPGVDLDTEMTKMALWLAANPAKGKTAKGMLRFINGWLGRVRGTPAPAPEEDTGPSQADYQACVEIAKAVEAEKRARMEQA